MSIDPNRYGLITNEFRWVEQYDADLAAAYSKAREMEIPTNFDLANLGSLLTAMFGVVGAARRRFAVDITGTDYITIDDFALKTPARYFTAPEFGVNMLPVIITRAAIIESDNVTKLELWG